VSLCPSTLFVGWDGEAYSGETPGIKTQSRGDRSFRREAAESFEVSAGSAVKRLWCWRNS
jgi:hypothetical protein